MPLALIHAKRFTNSLSVSAMRGDTRSLRKRKGRWR
jgi:hypothetical protein